jgi:hypothetical protein
MGAPNNTVGLDTTSAAIARGEVGANYSRYSTGNLSALAGGVAPSTPPMCSNSRLSMMSNGTPRLEHRDTQIELDSLPSAGYAMGGIAASPSTPNNPAALGRSRFSEYGLADNGSSEAPSSWRDSTLYESGRRESMQYYNNNNKSMEDTSLLWNEKNVEADECAFAQI